MSASPLPAASPDAAPIPLSTKQTQEHRDLANAIRALAMDAVEQAKSGHPGMPMGMAEIAEVLWGHHLRHNPANPRWVDRDRFVLSNGHGSMLLYALLHLTGYDLSIDDIKAFRTLHSKTPGHPEHGLTPGVETTTGPLGQGIANSVGFALAERMLNARFGKAAVDLSQAERIVSVGRGIKGQKSRAGSHKMHAGFEGGQMPLQRRVPKRGFTNIFRKEYAIISLERIAEIGEGSINPEMLLKGGFISSLKDGLKVLGDGELKKAVHVTAHKFSASAKEKIEKAGGKAEVIAA